VATKLDLFVVIRQLEAERDELRAQVGQLQSALTIEQHAVKQIAAKCDELRAENERLKRLLADDPTYDP
jgi:regulator of replication initiation timing